MNCNSRESILQLPFSHKELYSKSRNKTGYHVFLSQFHSEFAACSLQQQRDMLVEAGVHDARSYPAGDADSVCSVPTATGRDITRLSGYYWSGLGTDIKKGWNERAILVNELPTYGVFDSVPDDVTDDVLKISLTNEFERFQSMIKKAIRNSWSHSQILNSKTVRVFGMERVVLGSQVFRTFNLSYLMQVALFGKNYSFLSGNEIVNRYSKSINIHISSRQKLLNFFTKHQKCPFQYVELNKMYTCGGKVNLIDKRNNGEIYGYVMDEIDNDELEIILVNDLTITVKKPIYHADIGCWEYDTSDQNYEVIEYNPIRLKMNISGNCTIVFSCFVLNTLTNKLTHY